MAEQMTADVPEFAVVVRGYDRDQVDSYVAALTNMISQLRGEIESLRAETVEPGPPTQPVVQAGSPGSWAGLGPEVARLLEQAEAAAEVRRRQAEDEAAAIVEAARDQESQAAAQLDQLHRRWTELVAQLERLSEHMDQVLTQARADQVDGSGAEDSRPAAASP